MEFLSEYGMFLAKTLTIVLGVLIIVVGIIVAATRSKEQHEKGQVEVSKLNDKLDEMRLEIQEILLSKDESKALEKAHKAKKKAEKKHKTEESRARMFVVEFDGDIKASAVSNLREEITAILMVAKTGDEVFVKLQSAGGMVNTYGLAASQLKRIKDKELKLTISVDKVAASGGYMMACVADKILAAPFAILGSIGVVAQLPNFNRLLKKHDIDYEMITAGEYKRTISMFGENTRKGRNKVQEDVEEGHKLFKDFVKNHRPQVDIDKVATGEVWFATRAQDYLLVDELTTSDDYLLKSSKEALLFEVAFKKKKKLGDKLSKTVNATIDKAMAILFRRAEDSSYI